MNQQTKHDCREELRKSALKVTPARLGVLDALEHTDTPLDINTIISYLKSHHIEADKVTVFRIIHALTEKGLVKQIQFNEGKFRYEYADKPTHHHFICDDCGKVIDIEGCYIQTMEKDIAQKKGVLVKRHSLEFFGLCADCQK